MWGSATFYSGVIIAAVGLGLVVRPIRRLGITTRWQGLAVAAAGAVLRHRPVPSGAGIADRPRGDAARRIRARLAIPEVHTIRIAAPPARVFDAVRRVRADEIFLFDTLTRIRRGGRQLPPSILNAGGRESLIDVATANGFVRLADDAPRELVIGTVVIAPPGTRGTLTPDVFQKPLPPGFGVATMNFVVREMDQAARG